MGKHEMPGEHGTDDMSDIPGLHETHRKVRLALKEARRLLRDVMAGGVSIILFEWFRVMGALMPVAHKTEALVAMVHHVTF